jgi:hypothetical protein
VLEKICGISSVGNGEEERRRDHEDFELEKIFM